MTEERAREVMNVIKDRIPEDRYVEVRGRLLSANDAAADAVMSAKLHGTASVVLLSIFLGGLGIDRFVVGDVGLGIAKLLIGWLTFGLWPLIDIFFCYKKGKKKNYCKIMQMI